MRNQIVVFSLVLASTALAAAPFTPIPSDQAGGRLSGMEMRVVGYEGSSNGEISIDVRNPGSDPREFEAKGLYFVPDAAPDQAPQRVGAVGPFLQRTKDGWKRAEKTTIAAGATERLRLDVYCIDSHRASPSTGTGFRVAKDRLPAELTKDIDDAARAASAPVGGIAAPNAKGAVQSAVWNNRNKKWVKLDGESAQEATK